MYQAEYYKMPIYQKRNNSIAANRQKRACMVAYSFYEIDNRIKRYAETLVDRGLKVDVFALGRKGDAAVNTINGVTLYKLQEREVNERGKFSHFFRMLKFLSRSTIFLNQQHKIDPYDLIHVHSVPDFEVFAALLPKLKGAKIILDIHDIVPELYSSKFCNGEKGLIYKSLVLTELLSTAFASHVIISNPLWYETLIKRSTPRSKCTTIINYPDKKFFNGHKKVKPNDLFTMIYPGTLNWHQGLDIAIKAFRKIHKDYPNVRFHIYGEGPAKNSLVRLSNKLELKDKVTFKGMVPLEDIAVIMGNADLGIVPKRNDSFGGDAFSTKTLEFMALGVPIILSRTRIDNYYFDEKIAYFFEPENVDDLSQAMGELIANRKMRMELSRNAKIFAREYSWDVRKNIYLEIVDNLIG